LAGYPSRRLEQRLAEILKPNRGFESQRMMGSETGLVFQFCIGANFRKAIDSCPMFGGLHQPCANALAPVLPVDEPCFNIYLDKVQAWGIEALERCIDGVAAQKAVHICYGYGVPGVLAWKSQNRDWGHYGVTLPLLARSGIDQVSVECAASGVDVSVLTTLEGKDVLVGVIDVGTEEVESPELVSKRIRRVLPYVQPDRLFPCTDCGLVPRSREAARGKLTSLAAGAAIVRRELSGNSG